MSTTQNVPKTSNEDTKLSSKRGAPQSSSESERIIIINQKRSRTEEENEKENEEEDPKQQQQQQQQSPASVSSATMMDDNDESYVDVCATLKISNGTRLEVWWEVEHDIDLPEEDEDDGKKSAKTIGAEEESTIGTAPTTPSPRRPRKRTETTTTTTTKRETRWWCATLLPHEDGRLYTLDGDDDATPATPTMTPSSPSPVNAIRAPLRVLDYDAYPEAGFPDRSLEEVVFLSDHSLLNLSTGTRAHYRRHGDSWEPPANDDDDDDDEMMMGELTPSRTEIAFPSESREESLRVMLDTVLQTALINSGIFGKMEQLTAAQKAFFAERVSRAKSKLFEKLLNQVDVDNDGSRLTTDSSIITPEHVQQCMREVAREIAIENQQSF